MATVADIGKWAFSMGATEIEEVLSVSELGTTNSLLDVTNFQSDPGRMEYIAGLSDGSEISIECNRVPAGTGQVALKAAVLAQGTEEFTLVYNAVTTYTFNAVCMSEVLNPSISEQNKVSFSIKVSGDITETSV
jgi:hypothetical protein